MPSEEMLRAIAAGMMLVSAYRSHGHLAATLDPLGTPPHGDPSLDPSTYGLDAGDDERDPGVGAARESSRQHAGRGAAEPAQRLQLDDRLRDRAHLEHRSSASGCASTSRAAMHRRELTPQRKVQVLQRLTKVETMERYFRKQFMSQKTFSIEGLDVMIPMLEETISMLAEDGTQDRRARHGASRPALDDRARRQPSVRRAARRIRSRRDEDRRTGSDEDDVDGRREVPSRRDGHVRHADRHEDRGPAREQPLAPRSGRRRRRRDDARAADRPHASTRRSSTRRSPRRSSIHGDAAFAAQGVVAEVLNLQASRGLRDRRHDPHHLEQPGRLHDRSDRRRARRATPPTSPRATICRSCTSTPTTSRRASRRCTSRSTTAASSGATSSST